MVAEVHRAVEAGALGFSSSWGEAHRDGDGHHVPSLAATADELIALAAAVGDHDGTTLEFIPCVGEIPEDRMALMADMAAAAGRPLNWNLLGSLSPVEIYEQQLAASDVATARGAEVVALALPDVMRLRMGPVLDGLPAFAEVAALPDRRAPPGRRRSRDAGRPAGRGRAGHPWPARRRWPTARWSSGRVRALGRPHRWPRSPPPPAATPSTCSSTSCWSTALALTMVLPTLVPSLGATDEGWAARVEVWKDPRVRLGGSDAGAHADMMCHANYPTVVLGEVVRDRGLLSLEEAVRMMTDEPARLYGLVDRGRDRGRRPRRPGRVRPDHGRLGARPGPPRPARRRPPPLRRSRRRRPRAGRRHRDRPPRRGHRRAARHRAPQRRRHRPTAARS